MLSSAFSPVTCQDLRVWSLQPQLLPPHSASQHGLHCASRSDLDLARCLFICCLCRSFQVCLCLSFPPLCPEALLPLDLCEDFLHQVRHFEEFIFSWKGILLSFQTLFTSVIFDLPIAISSFDILNTSSICSDFIDPKHLKSDAFPKAVPLTLVWTVQIF